MKRLNGAFAAEQLRWYAESVNKHGYFTTTFWLRLPVFWPAIEHVYMNGIHTVWDGIALFCYLMDSVVPVTWVWLGGGLLFQLAVYRLLYDPAGKKRVVKEWIDKPSSWSKLLHVRSYLLVSIVHDTLSYLSMAYLGSGIAAQIATYIVLSVLASPFHATYILKVLLEDPDSARHSSSASYMRRARLLLLPTIISASTRSLAIVLSVKALQLLFAVDTSTHRAYSATQQVAIALCWSVVALSSWAYCAMPAYAALLLAEVALMPPDATSRVTVRQPPVEHGLHSSIGPTHPITTLTDSWALAKWSLSTLPSCKLGSAALWLLAALLSAFFMSPSANSWYPAIILEQVSRQSS